MVWPLGTPSGDAAGSSGAGGFTLKDKLQRVTPEDLAAVTPEDVEKMLPFVTQEALTTAMQTMLEENKFIDVLTHSSPRAWDAACRDIRPKQMQILTPLIKDRVALLLNVLPYLSEDFLTTMESSLYPF